MVKVKKETLEFIQTLKNEYDAGASIADLSRKYHKNVNHYFNRYNIHKRSKEEYKQWRLIHRPDRIKLNWMCESIKNETEAYILGFFMADGFVSKNKQFGFRLKDSDLYMVERIRDYFSKEITIGSHSKNAKHFVISSEKVIENLDKLGIGSNKTEKELSIPNINKDLIRHFIRGFFDGDGSIFVCKGYKNNRYLKCNICSPTINILEDIRYFLNENNIESKINLEKRKGKIMHIPSGETIGKMDMYRLFIRKKSEIKKFYHLLYDDSTIYLNRKKDVFDNNYKMLEYLK